MEEEKEYENTFVNTIKRDYGSLPSETPRYSLHLRNPSGSASQLSNTGSQSSVLCHQQSLSRTATKRLNFLTHPESPKKTCKFIYFIFVLLFRFTLLLSIGCSCSILKIKGQNDKIIVFGFH